MADLTCTVAVFGATWGEKPTGPLTACGSPAVAIVVFACEHEHIARVWACKGCVAVIQLHEDVLVCPHCQDGKQPHQCKAAIRIQWLMGGAGRGAA